jgi:sulfatase modifying factor 1
LTRTLPLVLTLALAACGGEPPASDPEPTSSASLDVEAPDGMVYVPGGRTTVGVLRGEGGLPHERPAFRAEVEPFLLDRAPVTVARFRQFVEATGYETQAEAFGDGAVLDQGTMAWSLVPGADWRRPFGPDGPAAPDGHPVTQVSFNDAAAFCAWDGAAGGAAASGAGRLPTEVEWEHAARGADDDRSPYAWGDALDEGGRLRANTWTGAFPGGDDGADGYPGGTSPVGTFGRTPLGLEDMGGNVWEWTASWYRPYPLGEDEGTGPGAPAGPTGEPERAQRGGSFLCHPAYCHGYRVSARSHATAESSAAHVGFRCARDLPEPDAPGGA